MWLASPLSAPKVDQADHLMSSVNKRIALNQAVLTLALVTVSLIWVAPAPAPVPAPALALAPAPASPIVYADSS